MTALVLLLQLAAPNLALTPGVLRDPPLTVAQICATAWGKDHRFVTRAMKQQVFRRYGIPWTDHQKFEVDHLVPRELGGADDVANLWPQPWPDAHHKDREENRLHIAVCAGTVLLGAAQDQMRRWGR